MLKKFLEETTKMLYPDREISIEKVGERFFRIVNDTIGCNDYLLDGKYTYDEVITLNKLTGQHCGFGFCEEIGPVAFIGVCNPHFCTTSGYFKYNVHEYGTLQDESEIYFNIYSDEIAKKVSNYTVYGFFGLEDVANKVPIAKLLYMYDSRYKCKKEYYNNKEIKMDLKLSGTYSFQEARLLVTGTTEDKDSFSKEEHPIQFAVVDDNKYVGIINLKEQDDDFKFRDVWEYGCEEPELQKIHFLSKEEAEKILEFSLYVYVYPFSLKTKEYPIEKKDRTFDSRFKFQLPDGSDYRLI